MKYIKLFENHKNDEFRTKIINLVNNHGGPTATNSIYDLLKRDCQPFLRELNSQTHKNFLYRFLENDEGELIRYKKTRKGRLPKDTSDSVNHILNDSWRKIENVEPRKDGVFVTNDPKYFGEDNDEVMNLFFPIGEYKYHYHKYVEDLFPFMAGNGYYSNDKYSEAMDKFLSEKNLDITKDDIADANKVNKWTWGLGKTVTPDSEEKEKRIIIKSGLDPENLDDNAESKIKEWAEKTLRTFFESIISDYKSEGILDLDENVEATVLCDSYYLIHGYNIDYIKLDKLIFKKD